MKQISSSACQQVSGGSYGVGAEFLLDLENNLTPQGLLYSAAVSAALLFFGVIWPVPIP